MDWKIKLFQILDAFGTCEGTLYQNEWDSFGVTPEEKVIILCEFEEWKAQQENDTIT